MLFLFHSLYVRSYWLIIPWKFHTICGHITGISTDTINFREYYFSRYGNIGFSCKTVKAKAFGTDTEPFLVTRKEERLGSHSSRMTSQPQPDQRSEEEKGYSVKLKYLFPSKTSPRPCPWALEYFKVAGKDSHLCSSLCTNRSNFKKAYFLLIYQI